MTAVDRAPAIRPAGTGPAVVVHIGEPKTGTTHFQEVLWRNRTLLATAGVQLAGHSIADQFRAMQDLRELPAEPDDPNGSWVGEWDVLARQARSARRIALVSQESIAAAGVARVEHAVRSLGPDVHVLLTVRDFAGLLPAEWQETVKHRRDKSWPDWLANVVATEPRVGSRPAWGFWRAHDTPEILRTWLCFVPAGRVHVVTMPPPTSDPGLLWRRLAGLLGIEHVDVDLDVRRNPSLGLAETEFLRRLNPVLEGRVPNWFYAAEVKRAIAHDAFSTRPSTNRPVLPPDVAAWARRRGELTLDFLRTSGVDVIGDLRELLPAASPAPPRDGGGSVAGDQLDAAVHALAAQVERAYERAAASSARVAVRPIDRSTTDVAMELIRFFTAPEAHCAPALGRSLRRLGAGGGVARARGRHCASCTGCNNGGPAGVRLTSPRGVRAAARFAPLDGPDARIPRPRITSPSGPRS